MKMRKLAVGLPLLFLVGCSGNQQSSPLEQLRGAWQLDKYESLDSATGIWHDAPKRIGYSGYILYDGSGHVGVQLMPPGFNKLNVGKTIDSLNSDELKEVATIQSRCFEYFADFKILNGQNIIEHHIQLSNHPDEIGTIVKRSFEFKGDTLILTANELIGGSRTRLRWIKRNS